jgi:phage terminase small subunit
MGEKTKKLTNVNKLTFRQKCFIREYMIDFSGINAAIRAGYSAKGARFQSSRLLAQPDILAEISAIEKEHLRKIGINTIRVLTEVKRLALVDIRSLYREGGSLKPPQEWDDDTAAAVAGIEVHREFIGKGKNRKSIGYIKKVKLWDKTKALDLLAKHLNLLIEKTKITETDPRSEAQKIGLLVREMNQNLFIDRGGLKPVASMAT